MKIINLVVIIVSVFVSVIAVDAKTLHSSNRGLRFAEELNISQIESETASMPFIKRIVL